MFDLKALVVGENGRLADGLPAAVVVLGSDGRPLWRHDVGRGGALHIDGDQIRFDETSPKRRDEWRF